MTLEQLPPLIIGGATFNTQYNEHPEKLPITKILADAFDKGMNAIDTSPYYGPSEELIGKALQHLNIERSSYHICTKVGRLQLDDFDYSPEWVEKSILRSLQRFNTDYIDVVFLHDVEFQTEEQAFGALIKLFELKSKGLINNVGISGYPVDYLYKLAVGCVDHKQIGPLDIVMSYSNLCLQNTLLDQYHDQFITNAKVKMVNNASILSMSLLTRQETKSFHPAGKLLKIRVQELAESLYEKFGVDISDLSTRFAMRHWTLNKKGRTVLGLSNVEEFEAAWKQWQIVCNETEEERTKDLSLVKWCQDFLGDSFGETWPSGIGH